VWQTIYASEVGRAIHGLYQKESENGALDDPPRFTQT
jgi:hypothetical protein